MGPTSCLGYFGEDITLLSLPGIKPFYHQCCSTVPLLNTQSQLPVVLLCGTQVLVSWDVMALSALWLPHFYSPTD